MLHFSQEPRFVHRNIRRRSDLLEINFTSTPLGVIWASCALLVRLHQPRELSLAHP